MIDGLKPYPQMKDSGVAWLGEVPEHWRVSPAFAAYRPRQVKNTGFVESTVLSLSYGRIIVKAPERLRGLVPESFETYQIVEPGNIIVRTTDLQNDQTSLRVGHAHHRGIITAAYMCLETKPIVLNEFGYQYLNAYDLLKIIYGFGSGLRQSICPCSWSGPRWIASIPASSRVFRSLSRQSTSSGRFSKRQHV